MENEVIKKRNLEIRKNKIEKIDISNLNTISGWLFNSIDRSWMNIKVKNNYDCNNNFRGTVNRI